ncbi:MAG: hypothetical protein HY390_00905, partial [Deltaproteobacteria bacterium]|nr:hypothetical protein [Deltaproteobacteria bacterium]
MVHLKVQIIRLFFSILALSLLFSSPILAAPQPASEIDGVQAFLTEYTGNSGQKWVSQVKACLKNWSLSDTRDLINYLEGRIGKEKLVVRLNKSIIVFSRLKLSQLQEIIRVYEELLESTGVNSRLSKSFTGFFETDGERLRGVIRTLQGKNSDGKEPLPENGWKLSDDEIKTRMNTDLLGFAGTDAQKLLGVIRTLQGKAPDGEKDLPENGWKLSDDEIKTRMNADLQGFARTNAQKLLGVI